MMVAGVSQWEVRIVRFVYGMWRAGKCYTRYALSLPRKPWLIVLVQLPGHKGTVTAVDFHPKEPISMSPYRCSLML